MPRKTVPAVTPFVMPDEAEREAVKRRVDMRHSTVSTVRFAMRMPRELDEAVAIDAKRLRMSRSKWIVMAVCMTLESRGVLVAPAPIHVLPDALERAAARYKRYAPHATTRWDKKQDGQN